MPSLDVRFYLLPRRFSANKQSVSIKISAGRQISAVSCQKVWERASKVRTDAFCFLDRHMAEDYVRIYQQLPRRDRPK